MIENGKFVLVDYTGTLSNGQIFDSSEDRNPLEFQIGAGSVIPAFEDAVKAMNIGDEKEINIDAKNAYGEYNNELIQNVPFEEIKKFMEPQEGAQIQVQLANGQQAPALIKTVSDSNVEIDFNHPLAGKDLNFKLKLNEVNDEAKNIKPAGGCSCGDDCNSEGCNSEGCNDEKCGDKN